MLQSTVAQTQPAAGTPSTSAPTADQRQKFVELQRDIVNAFAAKDYQAAQKQCGEFIALFPKSQQGYYNMACANARLNKVEEALASLAKAVELGYDDDEHMLSDEDLASLRDKPEFVRLSKAAGDIYEKAPAIDGVNTFEGNPAGGLRYRLRMSRSADKKNPNRLVIWLHPSGGSGNAAVEALVPMLLENNYALLVLTKKNWQGWSEEDAAKLLDKTLPEVGKTEGIDITSPILLGYSAGGQLAMLLYTENPGRFGGIIFDAAYPLEITQSGYKPLATPAGPKFQNTPVFAIVGTADNGEKIWRRAQPEWLKAGIPLTVVYVSGAPHAWLFGKDRKETRAELQTWLQAVSKGNLPGKAATQPSTQSTMQPVGA